MRMGQFFVDTLLSINDPRLAYYAALNDSGLYSGSSSNPDFADVSASAIGSYYGSAASIAPLATYVEAKFIEAEANLRLGNTALSANACNDAVKASVAQITGAEDVAYETAYASETDATISLSKIMYQKYVAMFTQVEVWNDWRRTNYPALTPNPAGSQTEIPRILPTSQDERLYNPNAILVENILNKVWWDFN